MMEAARQATVGGVGAHKFSVSRTHATPGRGRGRARARVPTQHSDQASPALATHTDTGSRHNHLLPGEKPHQSDQFCEASGRFDDAVAGLSISNKQNIRKHGGSSTDIHHSSDDKSHASDKENSSSPRTQRSHKTVFDSNMMSRINSHLQKGVTERSEANTRVLDQQNIKEASPLTSRTSRLAGSASRNKQESHTSQHAGAIPRALLAEGRPRSMTDPTRSSAGPEGEDGAHPVVSVSTSTPLHQVQDHASQATASTSSSVLLPKARGRGRGRGRARGSKLEMEVTPLPGNGTRDDALDHDRCESHSQQESTNKDRFADAEYNVSASDTPDRRRMSDSGVASSRAENSPPPSDRQATPPDSQVAAAGNGDAKRSSQSPSRAVRAGLSLKIDVDDKSPVAPGPEMCSPLPDDITQLLSPNHEYTLDWAAAMATPTPDTSMDSAPDWSISSVANSP